MGLSPAGGDKEVKTKHDEVGAVGGLNGSAEAGSKHQGAFSQRTVHPGQEGFEGELYCRKLVSVIRGEDAYLLRFYLERYEFYWQPREAAKR